MSTAPRKDDDVPAVDHIARTAVPARLRRAPRFGRIVGSGVAFGVGLGVILGLSLPNNTGVGRFMVVLLMSIGFALIAGLIAGIIALTAEQRSLRSQSQPDEAE